MANRTPAATPESPKPAQEHVPHYVNLPGISIDAYYAKAQGWEKFYADHRGTVNYDLKEAYDMILADLAAFELAQKKSK